MRTIRKPDQMQRFALRRRREGRRIVVVPTMGYLHAGHLSLIERARQRAGKDGLVVVTLFVNRTQFGAGEDFKRYPRDEKRDLKLCRELGADIVFIPEDKDMYAGKREGGFSAFVEETAVSQGMEGGSRPTHFRGVTTVVAKLFNITQPDIAVFGAKDFQQAAVIRRMVRDLNFPVEIDVAPTVREIDGVAMSSRNKYLTRSQREQAPVVSRAIFLVKEMLATTDSIAADRLKHNVKCMVNAQPDAELDYVEFFDSETLKPVKKVAPGVHMALAARIGRTRLIDNAVL